MRASTNVSTEDFIQHAVNLAEISALEWALGLMDKWPPASVKTQIMQYISELKEEEDGRE